MNTNDTVYSNTEEEYQEICEFLNRLSVKTPFMLWESGRMNFWRYNVHASKEREEAMVPVTNGRLDLGPREQVFYGEFNPRQTRSERVLVKIMGE